MWWRGVGLEILADGQEIDVGRAHVVHHLQDLALLLAEAHHDPGLGEQGRVQLLDLLQQAQGVEVAGTRADGAVEARHGLEIVVVDVGPGRDDRLDRTRLAQEVGGQDLDRGARA